MTNEERQLLNDMKAGDEFRSSIRDRADYVSPDDAPMWFGWAIMDAFLAGAKYGRAAAHKAGYRADG